LTLAAALVCGAVIVAVEFACSPKNSPGLTATNSLVLNN
jgi:hypothetical protein